MPSDLEHGPELRLAEARPSTTEEWRGRARREGANILAEAGVLNPTGLTRDNLLGLMAAAWLRGVSFGAHETLGAVEQAFADFGSEVRP